jgi:hypothetical protein
MGRDSRRPRDDKALDQGAALELLREAGQRVYAGLRRRAVEQQPEPGPEGTTIRIGLAEIQAFNRPDGAAALASLALLVEAGLINPPTVRLLDLLGKAPGAVDAVCEITVRVVDAEE